MQVSVITPTFNRPEKLRRALASLVRQTVAADVEAVVINDGGCPVDDVVREFRNDLTVTLRTLPQNQGVSRARNEGMRIAQGELVAFLDDDDVYAPDHLGAAIQRIGVDADFVFVNTPVVTTPVVNGDIASAEVVDAYDFPDDRGLLEVTNHIPPVAVVCRSPARAGCEFDTSLRVFEDWDMWLRMQRDFGYRFAYSPRPTAALQRIRGEKSLTTATLGDASALLEFARSYDRICSRFPARSEATRHARKYLRVFYDATGRLLDAGRRPHPQYYERCLRVLYRALAGDGNAVFDVESSIVDAIEPV
ncbi:MAG TPA: glycosyltransferase family 2 protein [Actinoplanes sp.]|jgi:glycosyltransferase involved in cell wall biosynthesis